MDRAGIYLFIAASYTPWLAYASYPDVYRVTLPLLWGLAGFGVWFSWHFYERYKLFSTLLYLFMGLLPSPVLSKMEPSEVYDQLWVGGYVYICGIGFFKER